MRGSLKQRSKGSWSIILDLGYEPRPGDRVTKTQAEVAHIPRHAEAGRRQVNRPAEGREGRHVRRCVDVHARRLADGMVRRVEGNGSGPALTSAIRASSERFIAVAPSAPMPMQQLRPIASRGVLRGVELSASTLDPASHHPASGLAKGGEGPADRLNIAADLDDKPRLDPRRRDDAQKHCWTAIEARRFLEAAQRGRTAAGGLLCARARFGRPERRALWVDVGEPRPRRRQDAHRPAAPEARAGPVFGPPKTGRPRTVALAGDRRALLRSIASISAK